MPALIKFLFTFRGGEGYGWTEVHYRNTTSTAPDLRQQLNNALSNIVPTRVALLGSDCALVGVRVSYPTPNGTASLGTRQFFPGTSDQGGSAAQLSLAVNFIDGTNTRSRICHLRGFWDAVEQNESYHPELVPGWTDALTAWKQALIASTYGWPTRDTTLSANGVVTGYAVATDGIVTFTLNTAMPAATWGTQQQIRFSRINRSNSVLNRSILCTVGVNGLTATSTQPHAATAFVGQGRYNFRSTGFIPYADTGSISVGERRMGRPLFRSPGRSKARPTA